MRPSFLERLDEEDGMSLIELLIAGFILTVTLMALASVAGSSVASVRVSRDRDLATGAASGAIEAARAVPYYDLALDDANVFTTDPRVSAGRFAHDGSSFEDLVVAPDGIQPYRCTSPSSCWFAQEAARHTVATYITWYDDPSVPGTRNAKRVTTVVTWTDSGHEREVRQSSILADARRGLGAPDFQVSNANQAITLPTGRIGCFQHLLENFGAADGYDWWYSTPTGGTAPSSLGNYAINLVYKNSGGTFKKWIARAWLGPDAVAQSSAWVDGYYANGNTSPGETSTTRMSDVDNGTTGGDPHLEQQGTVAKDEETPLVICYQPDGTQTPAPPETITFEARIRSAFEAQLDPAAIGEIVSHQLSVRDTDLGLHLEEVGDVDLNLPPARELPDYDGDGVPGYRLLKPSNDPLGTGETIRWADNQDVAGLTMKTNTLRLWTSWRDAAQFGDTTNRTVTFAVRLCVDAEGVSCLAGGTAAADATVTRSYTHNLAGWVAHDLSLSFPSAHTVDGGRFVRVQVTCQSGSSGSEEDCHLAYDTDLYPSRLVVSSS